MPQIIGWIANCCFVLGAYSMFQRRPIRYAIFNFVGNAGYIYQSIAYNNWSLLGLSLILGVLNVGTMWRWRIREGEYKEGSEGA